MTMNRSMIERKGKAPVYLTLEDMIIIKRVLDEVNQMGDLEHEELEVLAKLTKIVAIRERALLNRKMQDHINH